MYVYGTYCNTTIIYNEIRHPERVVLVPQNLLSYNSDVSERVAVKPIVARKPAKQRNQARGACFSPYRDLLNLQTWSGLLSSMNPRQ